MRIDWGWVEKELIEKERIPHLSKDGPKHVIHIAMEHCLKESGVLVEPKYLSAAKKIAGLKGDYIEIDDKIRFSGRRLSSYIKGASRLYLFLVTIGPRIEEKASELIAESEPLYGYLFDRIGSFAVESLAESMEAKLCEECASNGESASMRLSPGYCDWPIEEQFKMARVLDFSKIGVRLTQMCMMVPRKSISAIIGIGPKGVFSKRRSQCAVCEKEECIYRRVT